MAPTLIQSLRFFPLLAALAVAAPATGRADTFGLPPFTEFEKEWRPDAAVKGPDVLIARTPDEWAALWKKLDPKAKDAPSVDFSRWMVVGVATPADKPGRAVYRVELDDAAHPKELRVRIAADGALCQKPKNLTIKGARVHLVATGVSALPVRFIEDGEVDGGAFGLSEGTDQTPLGKTPGLDSPPLKGKAAYREQAERRVRESLTAEQVVRLRKGVWPGAFGDRYPQPWSVIQVRRGVDGWAIEYDGLRFTVDAETGRVAAAKPAGEEPGAAPAPEGGRLSPSDEGPQVPKAPPLACTIRSQPTCELGQAPAISVEIANWTDGDIYLVGSLDASDLKWRLPFCTFEVIGPDGNKCDPPRVARCGNMNAIREKDFVKAPRGGKFDPYQKIDDSGFFGSSQISPATFRAEGEYRIRFVYSTDRTDPKYWLGDVHGDAAEMLTHGGTNEAVVKLLAKVPKTTVSSNEITVKVVRPNK